MLFNIFTILIFIRPFISSSTFSQANSIYTLLLLSFLFLWLLQKGLPVEKIKPVKYPLLLFILALFVSTLFSANKINSLKEFPNYIAAILVFLAAASLSAEQRYKLIRVIILSAFVISLIAIYQYFFGFQHIAAYAARKGITDPFVLDYITQKRIFLPFVTPNALGGYLALVLFLVLIIKGGEKWLAVAVISFAILLTKSVGALFSLFLGMLLYIYLRKDFSKKKIVSLLILIIAAVFIFILRHAAAKEHLAPLFSISKRLAYWQETIKIIAARPLTGIGLGNLNLALSRYAHNSYLQIWAETGILGLISFLWLVGAAFKTGMARQNILLLTASLVFLLHNLLDFTFFLPEVNIIWWVILGILC